MGLTCLGDSPLHPVLWLDLDGVFRSSILPRPRSLGVAVRAVCVLDCITTLLSWLPVILGILNKFLLDLASSPTFLPLAFGVSVFKWTMCPPIPGPLHLLVPLLGSLW